MFVRMFDPVKEWMKNEKCVGIFKGIGMGLMLIDILFI